VKYEAKPTVVNAIQFTPTSTGQCAALVGIHNIIGHVEGDCLILATARGPEIARIGDYIVKRACGDIGVEKRDTFERDFQPAPTLLAHG
jgi:hypothetical protein